VVVSFSHISNSLGPRDQVLHWHLPGSHARHKIWQAINNFVFPFFALALSLTLFKGAVWEVAPTCTLLSFVSDRLQWADIWQSHFLTIISYLPLVIRHCISTSTVCYIECANELYNIAPKLAKVKTIIILYLSVSIFYQNSEESGYMKITIYHATYGSTIFKHQVPL